MKEVSDNVEKHDVRQIWELFATSADKGCQMHALLMHAYTLYLYLYLYLYLCLYLYLKNYLQSQKLRVL